MKQRRLALYIIVFCLAGCANVKSPKLVKSGDIITAANEVGVVAQLRIDSVEKDPKDPSGETLLYSVSVKNEEKQEWEDYCLPDPDNSTKAIPLSGYWDNDGKFFDTDKITTLACTNGVIAKCVRWGYKPWIKIGDISLKQFHLACVRMARADYCGNGVGHTKDGTMINIFDKLKIQERDSSTMIFEAAWSPYGATFLNHPRYGLLEKVINECPES